HRVVLSSLMAWRLWRVHLCPYTTLFRSSGLTLRGGGRTARLRLRVSEFAHGPWTHRGHQAARRRDPAGRCQSTLRAAVRHALYRSEEHTSELQSLRHLVCRLLLEKKNTD